VIMGQFKPMVKMETTEPSVELKLKKGGKVSKPVHKAMGGAMPPSPTPPAETKPSGTMNYGAAKGTVGGGMGPRRPSIFARSNAMRRMGRATSPGTTASMGSGPRTGPLPGPMSSGSPGLSKAGHMESAKQAMADLQKDLARPAPVQGMKKGGESKSEHKAKMAKTEQKLKEHASKPASKAHKGLKTGGVVDGQGGYKKGGSVHTTKVDTAKPDHSPAKTGDVKMGNGGGYKTGGVAKANGGGYKEGGAPKKAYATGGRVDSGRPVAMPQGRKAPPSPVSINRLSGTYKKGGEVMKEGGIPDDIKSQMQQAENERAYEAYERNRDQENLDTKKSVDDFLMAIPRGIKRMFSRTPKGEAVTETEKSVTVERAKKAGGGVC